MKMVIPSRALPTATVCDTVGGMPDPDSWNPGLYDRAHAFVYGAVGDLVDLLAPTAGERVLDLGCGTGHLTNRLVASGARVVGVDSSRAMVAAAKEGYPGLEIEVGDARTYRSTELFDAVFSNATLHWVRPPADAVATVWHALKPGGRFVAEFGGKGNVAGVRAAVEAVLRLAGVDPTGVAPWFFPSVGEYASLLETQGFTVRQAFLFPRPTPLEGPDGLRNWVTMFGSTYLAAVPEKDRDAFFQKVEDIARPTLFRDGVWYADYQRIRVLAERPS
jgi:trans-aconitate methyltransferase